MGKKVIITAALSGAITLKTNNPAVPYTPQEFAHEAARAYQCGASMVHVHAKTDDGSPTHEVSRVREIYDAIKNKTPEIIVNLSSAVGGNKTPEERITQIIEVKPEMASLNTNTMNFSAVNYKTGEILVDKVFTNTFTMLQDFGRAMEANKVKPEVEIYDIGGLDNYLLIARQNFFTEPTNFNFVWGVPGGQRFRPDAFATLVHALPGFSNFTSCGIGKDEFPAITQSCLMGGHMRVGLEDNVRLPNGELAKGNYELVEWAVRVAEIMGREPATPDEARDIMGIGK